MDERCFPEIPYRRVTRPERLAWERAGEAALRQYTKEEIERRHQEALAKVLAEPGLEEALTEADRIYEEWKEAVRRERAGEVFPLRHTGAGLCGSCLHARRIRSAKGSIFVLCGRAATDPRFPKYPRLPVSECSGYQERPQPRPR